MRFPGTVLRLLTARVADILPPNDWSAIQEIPGFVSPYPAMDDFAAYREHTSVLSQRLLPAGKRTALYLIQLENGGGLQNLFHPRRIVHAGKLNQQLGIRIGAPLLHGRFRHAETV